MLLIPNFWNELSFLYLTICCHYCIDTGSSYVWKLFHHHLLWLLQMVNFPHGNQSCLQKEKCTVLICFWILIWGGAGFANRVQTFTESKTQVDFRHSWSGFCKQYFFLLTFSNYFFLTYLIISAGSMKQSDLASLICRWRVRLLDTQTHNALFVPINDIHNLVWDTEIFFQKLGFNQRSLWNTKTIFEAAILIFPQKSFLRDCRLFLKF